VDRLAEIVDRLPPRELIRPLGRGLRPHQHLGIEAPRNLEMQVAEVGVPQGIARDGFRVAGGGRWDFCLGTAKTYDRMI
jgi:hypothetical protein